MPTREVLSSSPSFSSYSNSNLTEIAARVVDELKVEENSEDFYGEVHQNEEYDNSRIELKGENSKSEDENEDFEFAFLTRESQISSSISADEIFCNGKIRSVSPFSSNGLLIGNENTERENQSVNGAEHSGSSTGLGETIRIPLRKLFMEERETASSGSSSEADELDGVPPETYCVWMPKAPAKDAEAERCKKSNSTGTSRRWRFRNLLHRSHSDGRKDKDTFVLFTPSKQRENEKIGKGKETPVVTGKQKSTAVQMAAQYSKNSADRRKSYLPYRQDLIGFFSNVNG